MQPRDIQHPTSSVYSLPYADDYAMQQRQLPYSSIPPVPCGMMPGSSNGAYNSPHTGYPMQYDSMQFPGPIDPRSNSYHIYGPSSANSNPVNGCLPSQPPIDGYRQSSAQMDQGWVKIDESKMVVTKSGRRMQPAIDFNSLKPSINDKKGSTPTQRPLDDYRHLQIGTQRDPNIKVSLENRELWDKFDEIGTEMIITKSGRRMFPTLKFSAEGLDPHAKYMCIVDIFPADTCRYKYQNEEWKVTGKAEPHTPGKTYLHPESPASGGHWMRQGISFNKLKLTNNTLNTEDHLILNSMHKYRPRLYIIEENDYDNHRFTHINWFVFERTSFITVTAYQNEMITKLKIDNNPLARAFRGEGPATNKKDAGTQVVKKRPPEISSEGTKVAQKRIREIEADEVKGAFEPKKVKGDVIGDHGDVIHSVPDCNYNKKSSNNNVSSFENNSKHNFSIRGSDDNRSRNNAYNSNNDVATSSNRYNSSNNNLAISSISNNYSSCNIGPPSDHVQSSTSHPSYPSSTPVTNNFEGNPSFHTAYSQSSAPHRSYAPSNIFGADVFHPMTNNYNGVSPQHPTCGKDNGWTSSMTSSMTPSMTSSMTSSSTPLVSRFNTQPPSCDYTRGYPNQRQLLPSCNIGLPGDHVQSSTTHPSYPSFTPMMNNFQGNSTSPDAYFQPSAPHGPYAPFY